MKEVPVRAGTWQDVYLRLGVDSRPDLLFDIRLRPPAEPGIEVGIWEESSRRLVSRSTLRHTPGGRTLWLRVKADRGVSRREHPAVVVVTTSEEPAAGGTVRRATIPLRFVVHPASFWAGAHAGRWLGALVAAALVFFACTSVAHSRFLDLDRLAERLQPLRWNEKGETEVYKDSRSAVASWIKAQLPWRDRALSWLRANPLVFGLPGKTYEETVEIFLGRSLERLSVIPIPRHDARSHFEAHPDQQTGRLFASASVGNQVILFGRPDAGGRLGSLSQRDDSRRDRFDNTEVELRESTPRGSGPAGWRILRARAVARRRRTWMRLRWERGS